VLGIVSEQNVPVERLCEIAEAIAKNTHLEKLHLANTRTTDKVANVSMTIASAAVVAFGFVFIAWMPFRLSAH